MLKNEPLDVKKFDGTAENEPLQFFFFFFFRTRSQISNLKNLSILRMVWSFVSPRGFTKAVPCDPQNACHTSVLLSLPESQHCRDCGRPPSQGRRRQSMQYATQQLHRTTENRIIEKHCMATETKLRFHFKESVIL
jgi:hypothetical protein